ncbi:alpha/beta fold hydrolase [Dokdonella sp.]|uniref:S9 family peptidase n=1 Tax=Dokdonella sp. TaxID=2291710 RepID=UPI003C656AB0
MTCPRLLSSSLIVALLAGLVACAPAPDQSKTGVEAAAAPAPVEVSRPSKHHPVEDFIDTTGIAGASFSPDESRILFSSNKSGIWNAYTMPVGGGEWVPVTTSTTENIYAEAWFPNDDRKLVSRDQGGNELDHVYVVDVDGVETDLTPGENLKAQFAGFSDDDAAFYIATNERDEKFFDLYRYDIKSYERTRLYENKEGYEIAALSPDERWLALSKTRTTNDNNLFLFDRQNNKTIDLTPHEGNASYSAEIFSPDSASLLYLSDEGSEFKRLRRYMIADSKHEDVQDAPWDIVYVRYSHAGKYLVVGTNVDGSTQVSITEVASGQPVEIADLPAGEIRGVTIARSEQRMAFYVNGDRLPSELYMLELGQPVAQRLTTSLSDKIDPADLVDSAVVRFNSSDGMEIPNILWKPHQAAASNKLPALVWVHGGPGGQTTRGYNTIAQFLANNGYVVLGINNRGSSGYGKTFFAADDQKHGHEPLQDCVDAKKYLQSLDYVDGERIGIIGGSYGGYMVLAALAFQPDEFKVGVDIFGVSNWLRTLESIPPYWESFREALYQEIGNPETQREMLIAISPVFHAENINKPLMVLQGKNDPRVILPESDDIVAAVRKNNVPVEYVVFDDEGHGFSKKKNQIEGYGKILAFLDTYLKGDGVAAQP